MTARLLRAGLTRYTSSFLYLAPSHMSSLPVSILHIPVGVLDYRCPDPMWLYVGSWDLNSGLHTHVTSSLSTEASL